jgi:hypothetical protein
MAITFVLRFLFPYSYDVVGMPLIFKPATFPVRLVSRPSIFFKWTLLSFSAGLRSRLSRLAFFLKRPFYLFQLLLLNERRGVKWTNLDPAITYVHFS